MSESNKDNYRSTATGNPTTLEAFRPTYKRLSQPAVYRAIELPLSPVPQVEFKKNEGKTAFPNLAGPTSQEGSAFYFEHGQIKAKDSRSESRPMPIPLIVANAAHNAVLLRSSPVSLVVNAVHDLFERHLVDTEYDQFRWDCKCYHNHLETRFMVNLFSRPDKEDFFLIDFHRLSGDAFYFQSIYQRIHHELLKTGYVICNAADQHDSNPPQLRALSPYPLPDSCAEDYEVSPSDYDALVGMVRSDFVDVQREGLMALSNQLESQPSCRNCLCSVSEKLLHLACCSHDVQVRRLSVSALRLLTETCPIQINGEQIEHLARYAFGAGEISETRRQSAQLLLNLASRNIHLNVIRQAVSKYSTSATTKDVRLNELLGKLCKS